MPLSKDIFGNYVIQKILDQKDPNLIGIIVSSLKKHFYEMSLHMYGCRVIQKLLDLMSKEDILTLFSELKNHLTRFIEDQNGNFEHELIFLFLF